MSRERWIHCDIKSLLAGAKIEFIHHKSIDLEAGVAGSAPRACIDFAILHKRRIALIIEAKRKTTTHAIITALGQCVFYSHYFSLCELGSAKPFSRAIICVPSPIIASDLQHTLNELGIEICTPSELSTVIFRKLESVPPS